MDYIVGTLSREKLDLLENIKKKANAASTADKSENKVLSVPVLTEEEQQLATSNLFKDQFVLFV